MAFRHRNSIQASAMRHRVLKTLNFYLSHLLSLMSEEKSLPDELLQIEKDLEAIEAALVHFFISFPYNETLKVKRELTPDHRLRLKEMAEKTRLLKRSHLRVAISTAA